MHGGQRGRADEVDINAQKADGSAGIAHVCAANHPEQVMDGS
jgi:hypothetical protein